MKASKTQKPRTMRLSRHQKALTRKDSTESLSERRPSKSETNSPKRTIRWFKLLNLQKALHPRIKVQRTTEITLGPSEAEKENAMGSTDSVDSTEGSVVVSLSPQQAGGTKARVLWRLDCDDVKSAMLDMAAFKVKLLLDKGDKDLSFASSEQCMRFANAIHKMTNGMDDDETEGSDDPDDSIFVEQLSEEEQKVLEEFRQRKRHSQGPADLTPLTIEPEKSKLDKPP
jgi:hypothetical protein